MQPTAFAPPLRQFVSPLLYLGGTTLRQTDRASPCEPQLMFLHTGSDFELFFGEYKGVCTLIAIVQAAGH
jgi:hypothetical protein